MRNQKLIASLVVFFAALSMSTVASADSSSWFGGYSNKSVVKKHQVSNGHVANGDNELGFQFGPSIGSANFSTNVGKTPNADSRTRPTFGMFFEHRLMPYLSVRPELNYVQRGFSMTQGTGAAALSSDYAANYLEIPVLAKGQYQIAAFTPYVVTGPFMGFLIGKGTSTEQNGQSNDGSLDNQINSFNFGWNFGAGSSYAITKTMKADLGLRYSMGFTNVVANQQTNSGDSVKLNAFQILAGLGFAI
jgi:opacity protein-like surface antigen